MTHPPWTLSALQLLSSHLEPSHYSLPTEFKGFMTSGLLLKLQQMRYKILLKISIYLQSFLRKLPKRNEVSPPLPHSLMWLKALQGCELNIKKMTNMINQLHIGFADGGVRRSGLLSRLFLRGRTSNGFGLFWRVRKPR